VVERHRLVNNPQQTASQAIEHLIQSSVFVVASIGQRDEQALIDAGNAAR